MFNYLKKHNMRNSLKTLLCLTAICVFSNNAAAKICFLPDGNCGKTKININSGENGCIYKDKGVAETGMSKCEIAFQRNSCWWRRCNSDNKTIFDKLADCQKKIEDATSQECQACGSCYKLVPISIPQNACPDGYSTKYQSQNDCPDGKTFSENGTYNGLVCGACIPAKTCPSGYSTQYQSKSDCQTGETFSSSGKLNDLLCGKCGASVAPQTCVNITATKYIDTKDSYEQELYVYDKDDVEDLCNTKRSQGDDSLCPANCLKSGNNYFCKDDIASEEDIKYDSSYMLCENEYEVTSTNFNYYPDEDDPNYLAGLIVCSKNNYKYKCPTSSVEGYTYRLAGDTCKCSSSVVPIYKKLCQNEANSNADAKLIIFVKNENNQQVKNMNSNLPYCTEKNKCTTQSLSSVDVDKVKDVWYYESDSYYLHTPPMYWDYSKYWDGSEGSGIRYNDIVKFNEQRDYTPIPHKKVWTGFCQMNYCTVDVSDLSNIDGYDTLSDSEKLRIEEISEDLTDEKPFRPFIINAANTQSYEPSKSDGSLFNSCGSDECSSIANMYLDQEGACISDGTSVHRVTLKDDYSTFTGYYDETYNAEIYTLFYNPDTIKNYEPKTYRPSNQPYGENEVTDESVVEKGDDCYAALNFPKKAAELYDDYNNDYQEKVEYCSFAIPSEIADKRGYKHREQYCYNYWYYKYDHCLSELKRMSDPYNVNCCIVSSDKPCKGGTANCDSGRRMDMTKCNHKPYFTTTGRITHTTAFAYCRNVKALDKNFW